MAQFPATPNVHTRQHWPRTYSDRISIWESVMVVEEDEIPPLDLGPTIDDDTDQEEEQQLPPLSLRGSMLHLEPLSNTYSEIQTSSPEPPKFRNFSGIHIPMQKQNDSEATESDNDDDTELYLRQVRANPENPRYARHQARRNEYIASLAPGYINWRMERTELCDRAEEYNRIRMGAIRQERGYGRADRDLEAERRRYWASFEDNEKTKTFRFRVRRWFQRKWWSFCVELREGRVESCPFESI